MKRRALIKSVLAAPLLAGAKQNTARSSTGLLKNAPHIAVVGAGAFGGWTALHLLRKGARVTLLDAWGAGHSRSSSGGETRVIRQAYSEPEYIKLANRSLVLWRENERRWRKKLFHRTGLLFMTSGSDALASIRVQMQRQNVAHERLSAEEINKRFSVISPDGLKWGLYEPEAGFLLARQACSAVFAAFVKEGGEYRQANVIPGPIQKGELTTLNLSRAKHLDDISKIDDISKSDTRLKADRYVFACGPWLKKIFPQVLENILHITRQEVYYFGTPPGNRLFETGAFPVWAEFGQRLWYGIPNYEQRGFKIADDTRGPLFDPAHEQRTPTQANIDMAQKFIGKRFPSLKMAPLVEARVCQYTNTPDQHFIIDQHPEAKNTWIVGGGSGHGFKHGPALGEQVAQNVLGETPVDAFFALQRLRN